MARFAIDVAVRWSDQDAYGHVNNARFLNLLEESRTALLLGEPDLAPMLDGGVFITRHEIDYLRPVTYSLRPVRVAVWVSSLRAATFELGYELSDQDGAASVRAMSRLAPVDRASGRPRRLSTVEKAALGTWLEN